ncbi:hypothetical protein K8353_31555 [Burkholderia contaminans]|nr:hypothetical protein [Burkholderia contaminans]
MDTRDDMGRIKAGTAAIANADDASIWRWFAPLLEEHRLRWCLAGDQWRVSIDNRHVATDSCFDDAIRITKQKVESVDGAVSQRRARDKQAV